MPPCATPMPFFLFFTHPRTCCAPARRCHVGAACCMVPPLIPNRATSIRRQRPPRLTWGLVCGESQNVSVDLTSDAGLDAWRRGHVTPRLISWAWYADDPECQAHDIACKHIVDCWGLVVSCRGGGGRRGAAPTVRRATPPGDQGTLRVGRDRRGHALNTTLSTTTDVDSPDRVINVGCSVGHVGTHTVADVEGCADVAS